MAQKKSYHLFKEAKRLGSYSEYPTLPGDVDPQFHLSRNDRPQPFYLICDGDTLFSQLSGGGSLFFQTPTIKSYPMTRGDVVYVPAGTPHRFVPTEESVIVRVKAQSPALEGVAWYCESCGGEVHRRVWDARERFCQEGYLESCMAFNEREELRTCKSCGEVHPPVDISWADWKKTAEQLRAEGVSPAPVRQQSEI